MSPGDRERAPAAPPAPEAPAATATPGRDDLPSFVVIGAQKSASTFLQDQLALHPDVEIPPGEVRSFEDPFYGDGAVLSLPTLYRRPAGSAIRGFKRPDCLGRPEVAGRLHRHLPHARLLVVLRDPTARAVSAYYHFVRHGFVPLRPVDRAMSALLTGEWDHDYPRAAEVLSFGRYGEHLDRYLRLYPAEQMLVLDQADLVGDPRSTLRRAFAFVGADPDVALPERSGTVSNQGVYSPLRLRVLRTKNRTRFRYAPGMERRYPRRMTPWGWAYNASVVGVDRLVLSRFDDGRPPAIAEETRRALEDYYAADRELLRRVLSTWSLEPVWL